MGAKSRYGCQACGLAYAKWQGQCHGCQSWNSIEELPPAIDPVGKGRSANLEAVRPLLLQEVEALNQSRWHVEDVELSRTLGGGLVPGSLVLLGGAPGIGKSTLLLQLALNFKQGLVLYASGEESPQQVKLRAMRLGALPEHCLLLHTTHLETLLHHAHATPSKLLIVDSIQTLYTDTLAASAGSVGQIKACTLGLLEYAKSTGTAVVIVGHITKEGTLAGPKVLEHMVDTVLQFEGEQHLNYRMLRTIKNRFGAAHEVGMYTMQSQGLKEVKTPSELLLVQRPSMPSGIATAAVVEGSRSLLLEVQALVTPASYGTPQRSATGMDNRRLNMLLAVLEKRAGYRLGNQDVFLNIAGGMRVEDPALDLAVCVAIVSSLLDSPIQEYVCFAAEVGLGGEIRRVVRQEARIKEAEKLGFQALYIAPMVRTEIAHPLFVPQEKLTDVLHAIQLLAG